MAQQKQDPSLGRIIFFLLLIGALGVGVVRFSQWFNVRYIVGIFEAKAPADISEAEALLADGDLVKAGELLRPIVARVNNDSITPKAIILLARIHEQKNEMDEALELLKRATYDFPGSVDQPVAAVHFGRLLEKRGQYDEAFSVYGEVAGGEPGALRAPALTGLGRSKELQGLLVEARDLYAQAVKEAEWNSDAWDEAADALGRMNVELIFSGDATPESETLTVQKGDSITSLGMKYNTTQSLLMVANDISDPRRLRAGQRLKYTPKDFKIVIERSTCRLFLMDGAGLFKRHSVGLGKRGHETTLGEYTIGSKQKDPTWYRPEGGVVEPGDPENELGTRWMPFVPVYEGLPSDLGIHGTIHPETVGIYSSRGCPRMFKEEVEELYDLVVRATPVEVVDVLSDEQLAGM